MTTNDKNKTSNYGSIPPHHSPTLSIGSTAEEHGGDTFDVNDVLISHDQPNHQRPSLSAISNTHHHSTPSKRSLFDGWLRRDHSVHALTSSFTSSFRSAVITTIGLRGDERLAGFLGPTDHSVENLIRSSGGLGLEYQSLDRGIIDTAIWHRRKTCLIKERRQSINQSMKKEEERLSDRILNGELQDYEFDMEAVHHLEKEREWMQWLVIVVIGFLMAVIVSRTADTILDMKLDASMEWFERADEVDNYWFYGLTQHVLLSSLLAIMAFVPVALKPVSGGSGIAEAKATLNGIIIPNCTVLSTAFCKAVSVVCSVAASLPAGLEGPMIFMGLAVGENANRFIPHKSQYDLLRTDRARIDFAAIGCAAGVAAAFRSPVAGVLFAMEEGSSFWSTLLTWRCFLSACVTVISMFAILTKLLDADQEGFHVNSMAIFNGVGGEKKSNLAIDDSAHPDFDLWEYFLFAFVGAGGGVVGGLFCTTNRSLAMLRAKLSFSTTKKGLEVLIISAVCATTIWILPSLSILTKCRDIDGKRLGPSYFRQFNCEEGEYNELATLLLNPLGAKGITLLFTEDDPEAFSISTCIVAGLCHLIILCVAFGMSVSAGIFIPLLFIGSAWGRAFSLICNLFLDADWKLDPRTYAIIGSAATLGGVVRVLISLTAIVCHTTSLSFFMTPIMLATLVAQNVGNWVSKRPGIYDILLQLRGIPFLEESCPTGARQANIRARNVMSVGVTTIGTTMLVKDLIGVLTRHSYSDFPVVDSAGDGALLGSISRVDLLALVSKRELFFAKGEDGGLLTFDELDKARIKSKGMSIENIKKGLTADEEKYIYLSPYMQIAPITIHGHGSAERAYEIFRSLGIRQLLVVDKHSRPIGIIMRHELARLEEIGEDHQHIEKKLRDASISRRSSVRHMA